jgi:hypothetical protein
MSETKFTKGEWKVFTKSDSFMCAGKVGILAEGDCIVVADCNDWLATEKRHNANLIACAPEMYAMLDVIADGLLDAGGFGNCKLAKEIEALLAKARGES